MSDRAGVALASSVREFARKLRDGIGAERVILFGSSARGDWLRESDYDFIVVSPSFRDVPFVQRPVDLYQYWTGQSGIELLCCTPEEFEHKSRQISIVREAVREGIDL